VKVLVDTSVWSLAFRRRAPAHAAVDELRRLLAGGRAALIGPIRQEILNSLRDAVVFNRLRDHLRTFPDEPIERADYERAAEHFNICRTAGVQGSNTDFLICAVAERHTMAILTTDEDFTRYAALLPVKLHRIQPA
jgi:predicted nucleic acid-binding protein